MRRKAKRDGAGDGAAGSIDLGAELRLLEESGWAVVNERARSRRARSRRAADHVVSGPGGVFTIETAHARFGPRELDRARSHASRAERRLKRRVQPILCVPDPLRSPKLYAGVWCMSPGHVAAFLRGRVPVPLPSLGPPGPIGG